MLQRLGTGPDIFWRRRSSRLLEERDLTVKNLVTVTTTLKGGIPFKEKEIN